MDYPLVSDPMAFDLYADDPLSYIFLPRDPRL